MPLKTALSARKSSSPRFRFLVSRRLLSRPPTYIDCEILMSVSDQAFQNFSVAPNPARDQVVVRNGVAFERVILHNLMGQRLSVIETNSLEQSLSVGHLTPGVYFVTAEIQGSKHTVPLVKK